MRIAPPVLLALMLGHLITGCNDDDPSCADQAAPKMNAMLQAASAPLDGLKTDVERLNGCDSGDAPYVSIYTPAEPRELAGRFDQAHWKRTKVDGFDFAFESPDGRFQAAITPPEDDDGPATARSHLRIVASFQG